LSAQRIGGVSGGADALYLSNTLLVYALRRVRVDGETATASNSEGRTRPDVTGPDIGVQADAKVLKHH
jgi:hypothetical protein